MIASAWLVLGCMFMPLVAGDCSCKYQGSLLPEDLYTNYPSSEPGKYQDESSIRSYGTMCAAWDQVPGTPWVSSCNGTTDFSQPDVNWCQIPWCYVDESCDSRVASSVFAGSATAFYSYATCGNAPDCYSDGTNGPYGAGTAGCPYDPHGENTYMVYKQDCPCTYQGATLPSDLYTNYPTTDPGQYAGLAQIELYGTTCAAWDQSPDTPWYSSCPSGADWCSYDHNWCQAPWCYVSETCSTGVGSAVFAGSTTAYYSYDTCMSTPDCYTNSGADDRANLPASCPFDSTDNSWSTAEDCPTGWTAVNTSSGEQNVAGWAVRGGLAALAPLAAVAACLWSSF